MRLGSPLRSLLLAAILLVGGRSIFAQAAFTPFFGIPVPGPSASIGAAWYGNTALNTGVGGGGLQFLGTTPWYSVFDTMSSTTRADSPTLYPLSVDSGYHNARQYGRALFVANAVRSMNLQQQQAKNTKETADPLLGKGPASLSFWQWVKMGEMSLKTYGKIASIVKALQAGDVTLNVWKLLPKISVFNEDNPNYPVLIMGLVPSNQGVIALAKQITNFNDPRYYLGNLVSFNELQTLVPSLAVKPSFYGAFAHLNTADPASRNNEMVTKITKNFHEMRIALSMLNRNMAGSNHTLNDIQRSRFSSAMAGKMGDLLQTTGSQQWDDLLANSKVGAKMFGPNFAAEVNGLNSNFASMKQAEAKMIKNAVETKAADTWQAKRVAGNLANVMVPLETDEYMQGVKQVEDMVKTYAAEPDALAQFTEFDDQQVLLGLAVTDAWVNKMIHDEIRALRQIYAMQIEREASQKLAKYIVPANAEIQSAARRLTRLQNHLTAMQSSQSVYATFLGAGDIARIVNRMDIGR